MNLSDFKQSIKSPEPVYLVISNQDYLKRKVFEFCRNQVGEAARAFDWAVFDLDNDEPDELINAARTLPWMSPYRWIYAENAQEGADRLTGYLENPSDRTVVVLQVKKKIRGWPKLPVVDMTTSGSPEGWVRRKVKQEGYSISGDAAGMLVELVGNDLLRLESELEKLLVSRYETKQIDLDAVLGLTLEGRQRDVFQLISALAQRKREVAFRVLGQLLGSGVPVQQVIPTLYWNFSRLLVALEMLEAGIPYQKIVTNLRIFSFSGKRKEVESYSYQYLVNLLLRLRETDRLCKSAPVDPRRELERIIIDTCLRGSV
jgi:DNA polymerase-3 subunit delta